MKKTIKIIAFLLFASSMIYWISNMYIVFKTTDFSKGEKHEYLNNQIAENLINISRDGLQKYKKENGHFPRVSGKYFVDSIKKYIKLDAYYYADSVKSDGNIKVLSWSDKDDSLNYMNSKNVYLAVGRSGNYISYRFIEQDTFSLFLIEDK